MHGWRLPQEMKRTCPPCTVDFARRFMASSVDLRVVRAAVVVTKVCDCYVLVVSATRGLARFPSSRKGIGDGA